MKTYSFHSDPDALYLWNTRVTKSFLEDIQHVEVLLRNCVDTAVSPRYGQRWYVHPAIPFDRQAKKSIQKAERRAGISRGQVPPSGRVIAELALLQRLAAVRGRLSLCADQAAAAKWWLSMPMASVSAEGPMPKALSTRRTSPLMPGCRHQGRACPLRRARMTSNPLIVA